MSKVKIIVRTYAHGRCWLYRMWCDFHGFHEAKGQVEYKRHLMGYALFFSIGIVSYFYTTDAI